MNIMPLQSPQFIFSALTAPAPCVFIKKKADIFPLEHSAGAFNIPQHGTAVLKKEAKRAKSFHLFSYIIMLFVYNVKLFWAK